MSFMDTVLDVVNLARARNAESARIDEEFGTNWDVAYKTAPRPKGKELVAFLTSLPIESLVKLRALYYSGRGDDSFDDLRQHFSEQNESAKIHASMLDEKAPLPQYLIEGLRLAQDEGCDIES